MRKSAGTPSWPPVGSIGGPVLAGIDSIEGLRAWRDFVVDLERQLECRGGCPIGSLGSQLAEVDPSSRSHVSASFVRWECALQGALPSMYERGALTPEADPEALSLALLAAVQGGLLLAQIHRSTRPLETALDNVLDHIATHTTPGSSTKLANSPKLD
jgi:TetR/AcrR family transcriptional regulator, transcriptional repressor for nem operon